MNKPMLMLVLLMTVTLADRAGAGNWSKIRIATEGAYAPWNFTDASGQLVGFELDLARDLCKRMNAKCEIVAQAWDGIIPALQAGKYDAIMAGMSSTEKRKQVITFSRNYADEPAHFVVSEDSPSAGFKTKLRYINLKQVSTDEREALDEIEKEFKGKTIGVQTATTHENFLREYLGNDVEIRTYDTQEKLDLDLQAGRVDAALAAMTYWVLQIKSDKVKGMKMVGPSLTGGPFGAGVGVGIRKKDQDLADKFTMAINSAVKDGTVRKLAVQWFGFDATAEE